MESMEVRKFVLIERIFAGLILLVLSTCLTAQEITDTSVAIKNIDTNSDSNILKIKAAEGSPKILQGHLRMGTPTGPKGTNYGVNSLFFTRNGVPWLPVMGEIHYARVPCEFWEESVLAMKSGGLDIISTYVFWIFHEELQGQYDWQADRDLRRFLEICQKHDMPVWLRIGPWCHGEARNGGFPDWLSKVCKPRSMDPAYFEQVRRWYSAVAGLSRRRRAHCHELARYSG